MPGESPEGPHQRQRHHPEAIGQKRHRHRDRQAQHEVEPEAHQVLQAGQDQIGGQIQPLDLAGQGVLDPRAGDAGDMGPPRLRHVPEQGRAVMVGEVVDQVGQVDGLAAVEEGLQRRQPDDDQQQDAKRDHGGQQPRAREIHPRQVDGGALRADQLQHGQKGHDRRALAEGAQHQQPQADPEPPPFQVPQRPHQRSELPPGCRCRGRARRDGRRGGDNRGRGAGGQGRGGLAGHVSLPRGRARWRRGPW